ncbi:transcription initiation factor TFIIIB [Brevibacillus fluminis]|uniref:transcription initiation factor TFIIIB n=1 Tax=Brevibacillus fluminis TaxID=511487 RepID=UPI003F89B453
MGKVEEKTGKTEEAQQCPKCGSRELGKGKQSGYAAVVPQDGFFRIGASIIHVICTECGYIVESYVDKPQKFKE